MIHKMTTKKNTKFSTSTDNIHNSFKKKKKHSPTQALKSTLKSKAGLAFIFCKEILVLRVFIVHSVALSARRDLCL